MAIRLFATFHSAHSSLGLWRLEAAAPCGGDIRAGRVIRDPVVTDKEMGLGGRPTGVGQHDFRCRR